MSLNLRQAQFVREYLVDLNATQAAIRAGYSPRTAEQLGYQLLQKPSVAAAVAQAQAERAARTEITADRVLRELAKIGFSDVADVVSWGSREVAFGYDSDGKQLPVAQLDEAVMVRHEQAPFVEAIASEDLPENVRSAVSEVALTKDGLRIKMHDKRAALQDIGRHLGMFKDRMEHSGIDGAPIETTHEIVTRFIRPGDVEPT